MPEDGGLINQALIGLKPVNACVHTYTKPQTSSTRSRGLGWLIHESVEDTKLSTNKQHTLCSTCPPLSSSPHANSFVIGPAVTKHTRSYLSMICSAPSQDYLSRCICRCSRLHARLSLPRVLLPHTYTQDGWFLQPERRPARRGARATPPPREGFVY